MLKSPHTGIKTVWFIASIYTHNKNIYKKIEQNGNSVFSAIKSISFCYIFYANAFKIYFKKLGSYWTIANGILDNWMDGWMDLHHLVL